MRNVKYDIALSFAGEDRPYVEAVAEFLSANKISVFYDAFEEVDLWGKDLYLHLCDVYQNQALYTVIFISDSYVKKLWTKHELRSAQARAFVENREYILPARFDDSDVSGVLPTTGFIDLRKKTPVELSNLIIQKLGRNRSTSHAKLVEKEIGTLWSDRADIDVDIKVIKFMGVKLATVHKETMKTGTIEELYQLENGKFVVYTSTNHSFDYRIANLFGVNAYGEIDPPLSLEDVQKRFPSLATQANLYPVMEFVP